MKTEDQINRARDIVCLHLSEDKLNTIQKAVLSGMSVALRWVMDVEGLALQDLLDGRPIKVSK